MVMGNIALFVAPVMVVLVLAAFFALVRTLARNYIKVAPNEVLVIYGRSYKDAAGNKVGCKLITGGAAFVFPMLEKYKTMALDAFQVKFSVTNVPSKDGVKVTVEAVASLKVGSELTMLTSAVSRFLDMSNVSSYCQQICEGGLRGVVAGMTVEELVRERNAFGAKVQEEITGELGKVGVVVDSFLIQEITDAQGYIESLGKKRTAEVRRDATIGEADATREADQRSSSARQAGETAKAAADQAISDATRQRDIQIAQNQALVTAEQAKVKIAGEIAMAERDKDLRVKKVEAEMAETQARTLLQEKEKARHDAELEATLIVQANRDKEARIIAAEGAKQSQVITAEGTKTAAILTAEGEKAKQEQEAQANLITAQNEAAARKAKAAAQQAEMEAEAAGNQAKLTSEAAGNRAQLEAQAAGEKAKLMAEADGTKAKLLAEAEGIQKKAEAYRQLDAAGKLLLILEHAPEIIQSIGEAIKEAGEGTLAPMAQAIGVGISGIEEVRIIDLGGGGGQSQDAMTRFAAMVPKMVFDIIQHANATGLGDAVQQVASKLGIDLSAVAASVASGEGGQPKPAVVVAVVPDAGTAEAAGTEAASAEAAAKDDAKGKGKRAAGSEE